MYSPPKIPRKKCNSPGVMILLTGPLADIGIQWVHTHMNFRTVLSQARFWTDICGLQQTQGWMVQNVGTFEGEVG